MGKGGKAENREVERRKMKRKESSSSQEEEIEQSDEDGREEQLNELFDVEQQDSQQLLLERINDEIMNAEQPFKLTWAAIHQLKQQQKCLNDKMDEEIMKIHQKYEILKVPIISKLANVASGHPVQKQIYTKHEMTKNLSVNKTKPKAIPGFWLKVFESAHFISGQEDRQILQFCTRVQCNTTRNVEGEQVQQTISVALEFADNPVIQNKQLKAIVHRKGQQITVKQITNVLFKKNQPQNNCSFFQIFNQKTIPNQIYSSCVDLQRIYNNAVFHYFYEAQIEDGGDEQQQAIQNEGDEDEDEDDEEDIRPVKKAGHKGKEADKPLQKPECKNQ